MSNVESIWGNEAQTIKTSVNSYGNMNYLKINDGESKKLRILGTVTDGLLIRGWMSFKNDKPFYSTLDQPINKDDLGLDKYQQPQQVWEFWSVPVWNHFEGRIQVWEIKQKTIQKALFKLTDPDNINKQWADWRLYDIEISFNNNNSPMTKYTLQPYPPEPISPSTTVKITEVLPKVSMDLIFQSKDPLENIIQEPITNNLPVMDNRPFIDQAEPWKLQQR